MKYFSYLRFFSLIVATILFGACSQAQRSTVNSEGVSDAVSHEKATFTHKLPWPAGLSGKFGCIAHGAGNGTNTNVHRNIPAYDFSAIGGNSPILASSNGVIRKLNNKNPTGKSCHQDVTNRRTTFAECWPKANYVIIAFLDDAPAEYKGREAVYFHLATVNPALKEGDFVRQGTYLGTIGQSGFADGVHLHYHIQNKLVGNTIWHDSSIVFENFEEFANIENPLENGKCFAGGFFPTPASTNVMIQHNSNQEPPVQAEAENEDDTEEDTEEEEPIPETPNPVQPPIAGCYSYGNVPLDEPLNFAGCEHLTAPAAGKHGALRRLMVATCFIKKNGVTSAATGPDAHGGCACLGWVIPKLTTFCAGTETHANFSCVEKIYPDFKQTQCP